MLNTMLRQDVENVVIALYMSNTNDEWRKALDVLSVALGLNRALRYIDTKNLRIIDLFEEEISR